jgi:CRISPR-associated protein (TIGR02584 family)
MGNDELRCVLLCMAGLTPQIITENLYGLMVEGGERVDEVRVITTAGGKQRIVKALLEPGHGMFFQLCRDYGFDPARISFDERSVTLLRGPGGRLLEDIRTAEENKYAGDQICEMVRELTADKGTRIHASAAGGRKTLGIYLTAAMQLFGRIQDRLSHVLISEDFETHQDFFYKPPVPRMLRTRDGREVSTADAEICLADIPFIRLHGLGPEWTRNGIAGYGALVLQTQRNLDLAEAPQEMRIDLRGSSVHVADNSVHLPPREFFYYLLFIHIRRRRGGQDGFVSLSEIVREDLDAVFRVVTAAQGRERVLEEHELVTGYDFLTKLVEWVGLSYVETEFETTFREVKSKLKRRFADAGLRERYVITSRGRRGNLRFGIAFPPEHICLC